MSLEEVEREIRDIYRWWAEQAPGVAVQEIGRLADLWRYVDLELEAV